MRFIKRLLAFAIAVVTTCCFTTAVNAKPVHVDYLKPSENKPYPNVQQYPQMWVHVDIKRQRVYLMSHQNKKLYTMYCSTGKHNATPTGTYHIEDIRGEHFYSSAEKCGGNYYVAWKGNDYLFHSTPVDAHNHYIKKEASYLGRKPASHGCVRLTVPDAKWFYQNIPTGTTVVITK
ncbi:L,D-transpeptidase [uncultured Limosilactobacillus sp.]|uniref:L,D-transpeptidase n=1 Tax=uncultured Limosilactobacillus sp. TaxID=2837629 RepID=UPI0025EFF3BB|nr:L,D-transpeptidase [uncultured Limosilactobacillus sp.]